MKFMEESSCASFDMSKERCHKIGGKYVKSKEKKKKKKPTEICVSEGKREETCVTQGGEQEISFNAETTFLPGQKACHLTFGYMCDTKVGFLATDRIYIVPKDDPCPSFQDWELSCYLLNNQVESSAGPALTVSIVAFAAIMHIFFL